MELSREEWWLSNMDPGDAAAGAAEDLSADVVVVASASAC